MKHYTRLIRPYLIWSIVIVIVPFILIVLYSFTTGGNELVNIVYSMMCSQEDYQAGHMEHLYIVSYDPGLHYNPDAEAVMVDLDEPTNREDLPELSESVS